jgi:predicted RNase H-like HicB family nuclease
MKKNFTIVIEKDEAGYFVGSTPELPGCHTQAKSIDKLLERMKEAISVYLEVKHEEKAKALNLVGVQTLEVAV